MATFEEVNAAILAYRAARDESAAQQAATQAAQVTFEAAVAAAQAVADAAINQQTASVAQAQAAFDVVANANGAAFEALFAAEAVMLDAVASYEPPEP